jgi:hypothetical protein
MTASRAVLGPVEGATMSITRQHLDSLHTTWHITFGTYGTRLHGSGRATVDKRHNQLNEAFLSQNSDREDSDRGRMKFPQRYLALPQRVFAEVEILSIYNRVDLPRLSSSAGSRSCFV